MDVDDHQNYLQRALISSLSTSDEAVFLDEIAVNREILLDHAEGVVLEIDRKTIVKSFEIFVHYEGTGSRKSELLAKRANISKI